MTYTTVRNYKTRYWSSENCTQETYGNIKLWSMFWYNV